MTESSLCSCQAGCVLLRHSCAVVVPTKGAVRLTIKTAVGSYNSAEHGFLSTCNADGLGHRSVHDRRARDCPHLVDAAAPWRHRPRCGGSARRAVCGTPSGLCCAVLCCGARSRIRGLAARLRASHVAALQGGLQGLCCELWRVRCAFKQCQTVCISPLDYAQAA